MPCEVVLLQGWFFQNGCRCHGNDQNAKKLKNTKMIIAGYSPNRNWWNLIGTTSTSRDKPKKSESVGQTLSQLPWKQKKGVLKKKLDSFHQASWIFVRISTIVCGSFWGLKKFKMAAIAMVTKVQKMLNSLQTSQMFAVMFPVTSIHI